MASSVLEEDIDTDDVEEIVLPTRKNSDQSNTSSENKSDLSAEDTIEVLEWYQGALIGSGSFGKVYLGLNLATWELMAVKQVSIPKTPTTAASSSYSDDPTTDFVWKPGRRASKLGGKVNTNIVHSVDVELNILRKMSHPGIVRFIGAFCYFFPCLFRHKV
jgi:hypothetical protein